MFAFCRETKKKTDVYHQGIDWLRYSQYFLRATLIFLNI